MNQRFSPPAEILLIAQNSAWEGIKGRVSNKIAYKK